ncbi:MAG: hypothetical protein ACRC0J_00570, partial [Shewanella oncorhynchi]
MSTDRDAGDTTLTFTAPHGLAVDDVIAIQSTVDYSFSYARSYYRSGEFQTVLDVPTGNSVIIRDALRSPYNAATATVAKMVEGKLDLRGTLTVECLPGSWNILRAVFISHLVNENITGTIIAKTLTQAGIIASQCYKSRFPNMAGHQGPLTGLGLDYGVVFSNCSHCAGSGDFSAARHAIANGGGSGIGAIPNFRNTWYDSQARNTGAMFACDTHGNCRDIIFSNVTADGGFSVGGFETVIDKCTITPLATNGIAVYAGERMDYNISVTNCVIRGNRPTDAGLAVINIGASNTADNARTLGGTLDFSGTTINCPLATRIFSIRPRETAAIDVDVCLRDTKVRFLNPAALSVYADSPGVAPPIRSMVFNGYQEGPINANVGYPIGYDTAVSIATDPQGGSVAIPYTTAQSTAFVDVVYPTRFQRIPVIALNSDKLYIGAELTVVVSVLVITSGFR